MDEPDKRSPGADDAEYREMHIPHLRRRGTRDPLPLASDSGGKAR